MIDIWQKVIRDINSKLIFLQSSSLHCLKQLIQEKNTTYKYECERQRIVGYSCLSAQKNKKQGGGGGGNRLDFREYTPLYKKGIKKTENKPMETTHGCHNDMPRQRDLYKAMGDVINDDCCLKIPDKAVTSEKNPQRSFWHPMLQALCLIFNI